MRLGNLEYKLLRVSQSVRSEVRDFWFGGCGKPQARRRPFKEGGVVVTLGDQNVNYAVKFSLFLSSFQGKMELKKIYFRFFVNRYICSSSSTQQ